MFSLSRSRVRVWAPALLTTATWSVLVSTACAFGGFQYVSPLPGSSGVSPRNNVVVRDGRDIDAGSLESRLLSVTGSISGAHSGRLTLSDDRRSLVFVPDAPYAPGERVTVHLAMGLRTNAGLPVAPLAYSFSVAASDARRPVPSPLPEWPGAASHPAVALTSRASPVRGIATLPCDTLPRSYPIIRVGNVDHPDSGDVFLAPFTLGTQFGKLVILDNAGQPLFYRRRPAAVFDFKMQPNGLLTYFGEGGKFWGMDSTYAVVDSFACGNGYGTDVHDLQLLPNGHALLMSYDVQAVRMDLIVPGGRADAYVIGLILQEIDQAKNVVFQWRSWDHMQVTDTDTCLASLRDSLIDFAHGNAVEPDADGNLLVSSRNMSEITKIDRTTGDILWRMGRNAARNEFTFPNDPRGFSGQHDIRRLPNGHVTLFDDGNCLSPPYSRALEYALDEVNHVATLAWEYRSRPDIVAGFLGNVQRRGNGSTLVGWGGTSANPKVTDLHADGRTGLTIDFGTPDTWTYRAFRTPWRSTAFTLSQTTLDCDTVRLGASVRRALTIHNPSSRPLPITCIGGTDSRFTVVTPIPFTIPPGQDSTLTVRFTPDAAGPAAATLYVRTVSDSELVAQPFEIRGVGEVPVLSLTTATPIVTEGNSGTRAVGFTVNASFAPLTDVTVTWQTVDGTAKAADLDYLPASGVLTIPAGSTSAEFSVSVVGDRRVEGDENFSVALVSPTLSLLGDSLRTIVITDDDGPEWVDGTGPPPASFTLFTGAPSPFRDVTAVRFDVATEAHVRLRAFDVRGRQVATIVDGTRAPGRYTVNWTASGLESGIYFLRYDSAGFAETRRVVLIR